MKGASEWVTWIVFSLIIVIATVFLLYVVFPRSECDDLALMSSIELKGAIECAASDKVFDCNPPYLEGSCCNDAVVKFCQEGKFSIFGVGFIQSYMGLMIPEYMVYFKQFPKKKIGSLWTEGVDTWAFSESYPFERATVGQRWYDIRPTLTQFKEYFKTKYLLNPCTEDDAICLNIRGKEEVVDLNLGDITDIRLDRKGFDSTSNVDLESLEGLHWKMQIAQIMGGGNSFRAEANPTFYLIAPCHSKVSFIRSTIYDDTLMAFVDLLGSDGANYCYADTSVLQLESMAAGLEVLCEVGDTIVSFISGGTTAGATAASKEAVEKIGKETVEAGMKEIAEKAFKEGLEQGLKKTAKYGGKQTTEIIGKEAFRFAFTEGQEVIGKTVTKEVMGEFGEEAAEKTIKESMEGFTKKTVSSYSDKIGVSVTKETTSEMTEKSTREFVEGLSERVNMELGDDVVVMASGKNIAKWSEMPVKSAVKDMCETAGKKGMGEGVSEKLAKEGTTKLLTEKTVQSRIGDVTQKAINYHTKYFNEVLTPKYFGKWAWSKQIGKAVVQRFGKMNAIPPIKPTTLKYMFRLAVPCVDVDYCRGFMSCLEALMWPSGCNMTGANFEGGRCEFDELVPSKMKDDSKSVYTATDIFMECCKYYNYGIEKDPEKIICDEPRARIPIMKSVLTGYYLKNPEYINQLSELTQKLYEKDKENFRIEDITMKMLSDYIGFDEPSMKNTCSLIKGFYSKSCEEALEVVKEGKGMCWDFPRHTYDFGDFERGAVTANVIDIGFQIFEENCKSDYIIEISNVQDKKWEELTIDDWEEIYTIRKEDVALKERPEYTHITIKRKDMPDSSGPYDISSSFEFRYIRIRDNENKCSLDYSAVMLDPNTAGKIDVVLGETYKLTPDMYNTFKISEDYYGKASELCNKIDKCYIIFNRDTYEKFYSDNYAIGEDFDIIKGSTISIRINGNEESSVKFEAD